MSGWLQMRLLLDECVPARLKRALPDHEVSTVVAQGWSGVKNGKLLRLASQGFDAFITVDKNLPYQQNQRTLWSSSQHTRCAPQQAIFTAAAALLGHLSSACTCWKPRQCKHCSCVRSCSPHNHDHHQAQHAVASS